MVDQSKAINAAKERMQPVKEALNPDVLRYAVVGIVTIGIPLLIFAVMQVLSAKNTQAPTETHLQIPDRPLFGFWQDKSQVDYWIAKVTQTAPARFTIKWNGRPQRDGKGNGTGFGAGIIQGDGKVHIEIDEQIRTEANQTPLLALPGMSTNEKTQKLILEGRYYQKPNGHSFFEGDYVERGAKFYPFTHWVLEPDLPKGWTMPG